MAEFGEVGSASVAIRADFAPFNRDLAGARDRIGKQGDRSGRRFNERFTGRLRDARGQLAKQGEVAGRTFGEGFTSSASRFIGPALAGLVSVAAIQRLGDALIGAARPFNAALAETSTLIDGTAEELDFLSEKALELGAAFGTSGAEQVRAFYQAISAGAGDVREASELLDTANRLAIGGVTDLVTAVDVLTTATNAYSESGLTAADASDILFTGVRAGKTTADELGGAIGRVATIAANAGVGFDQLVAAVAALTSAGINTSEAVNGVRAIIAATLKPSAEATKLAKQLGLEFNGAALSAKGLQGFLADLEEKTGGSNEAMAVLLGGVEALAPAIALTGGAAAKFADTMEDMGNRTGATEAAFDKVADSLDQRLNVVMGKFTTEAERAGSQLLSVLVPALESTAENLDVLGDALIVLTATQIPRMVAALATMTAGMTALGGAATAAKAALSVLGGPIGILVGLVATLALNFDDATEALGRLTSGSAALKDATDKVKDSVRAELEGTNALSRELATATSLSVDAAKQKLAEAKARFENVRAAIAEQRALALGSDRYAELSKQIRGLQGAAGAIEEKFVRGQRADAFEKQQQALAALIAERGRLVQSDQEMVASAREAESQIAFLNKAIAAAKDGIVTINEPPSLPELPGDAGQGSDSADKRADAIDRLNASIGEQIRREARAREEIGATIATIGEEKGAREALIDQLRVQQLEEDILREARQSGLDLTEQEVRQIREQIGLLATVTDLRSRDEQSLRRQEDAAESARQAQEDMASALKSTGDELIRAALEGGNFIEILSNLALKLLEIQAIQLTQPSGGGGGGGGLLGSILGGVLNGIAGGIGGGLAGGVTTAANNPFSGELFSSATGQVLLPALAGGGHVFGSGTGTSDSIPAMLSDGEFVINAKATAEFLPLLEAINSGDAVSQFASGGAAITRHYGSGGMVAPVSAGDAIRNLSISRSFAAGGLVINRSGIGQTVSRSLVDVRRYASGGFVSGTSSGFGAQMLRQADIADRAPAASAYLTKDDLNDALANSGPGAQSGRPVTVTMNIQTPDVGSFRRSQGQVAAELGRMIRQGQARQT